MLEKTQVLNAIKKLREENTQRKFKQTFDLIISLKDLNLKKPDEQVDFYVTLPHPNKKIKICGFVGGELKAESEANLDKTIQLDDFDIYKKDPKKAKKIANEYDYFIAQGNLMAQVAGAFGRILGTRGKMPNPKAGCIVPPNANLGDVSKRLQNLVRLQAKKHLAIQLSVGKEESSDEDIAENVVAIYKNLAAHLPKDENNIRSVLIKFTMSKPVKVE